MRVSKFEARYVSRHHRQRAWIVQVAKENRGKYFGDKKYGGRAAAYRKAIEYAKRITDEIRDRALAFSRAWAGEISRPAWGTSSRH